jgi:hypothetical protein
MMAAPGKVWQALAGLAREPAGNIANFYNTIYGKSVTREPLFVIVILLVLFCKSVGIFQKVQQHPN